MNRFYRKWLCLILALALGLSPMQSVLANIMADNKAPCQMAGMDSGSMDQSHCKMGNHCADMDCASSHCFGHSLAIFSLTTPGFHSQLEGVSSGYHQSPLEQQPPVPLRPPRA